MFILIALVALFFVIIYQIGKASEYAGALRGEEETKRQTNRVMAWLLLAFFVLGLYGIWECHQALVAEVSHPSASYEGVDYDSMFNMTLLVTGIVFFITQTLLFVFAFRFQSTEKRTSFYYAHNNRLELIWTTIPAIVMFVLVAIGLRHWFHITGEPESKAGNPVQIVEVVGKQFNWIMRYPGKDGELGKRDFRNINDATNVLGLDTADVHNQDDIVVQNGELHIAKDVPVKLIIGSRDVIHDVGLPQFRFKMDAVPGITSTLWFTPRYTNDEMKKLTGNPDFAYEISCDQMCGKGHYSMRGTVIVHKNRAELEAWLATQKPYLAADAPATDSTAKTPGATAPAKKDDSASSKAISMNTPKSK